MKKNTIKLLSLVLVLTLALSLAACKKESNTPTLDELPEESQQELVDFSNETGEETETPAEPDTSDKILIGASPSPHSEILTAVKPLLEAQGITLEIVEFTDYVLPNLALQDGSLDANYFQHEPYLIDFNEGNSTDLVTASFVHYEPMGLYPGTTASIEEISEGARIAVPNDATNEARALLLLEAQGLITLEEGIGIKATPINIIDNPYNIEIVEVEASQAPAVLPDVSFAVINSNYALDAGVIDTAIVREDENSVAVDYANIIAVKAGNENDPKILALVEALKSPEIESFIAEQYKGAIIVYKG